MNYIKSFNFLKKLPFKLNSFYKKKSKSGIIINNKSKSKKDFDPVTNFDKAFEKYIRSLIIKKFPKDSIIGEEFNDKFSSNNFKNLLINNKKTYLKCKDIVKQYMPQSTKFLKEFRDKKPLFFKFGNL